MLSLASHSEVMVQTTLSPFGSGSASYQVANLTWSVHNYLLSTYSQVDQLHRLEELIQKSKRLHCRLGKGLALFCLSITVQMTKSGKGIIWGDGIDYWQNGQGGRGDGEIYKQTTTICVLEQAIKDPVAFYAYKTKL